MKRLIKSAIFTDTHFGKKNNSDQHNTDILNFCKWFCERVREDPAIDNVVFCGDWFENRSSVDIKTLNFSYSAARMLNSLGLPIFFIVGNHDLYQRHTRDIFSTAIFHEFNNFQVISHPQIIKYLGDGSLITPFLFDEEYTGLAKFKDVPVWFGHFSFNGFTITGYNAVMENGPDSKVFSKQDRIFSGHFHKRQIKDNIIYIGNTFPMDFGDAGDFARGMAVYDHIDDKLEFKDWAECPKYIKVKLSELVDDELILPISARVKCLVDFPINFEESNHIRQQYVKEFLLREFAFEDSIEVDEAITDTEVEFSSDQTIVSVDELIIKMLSQIKTEHIDNEILLKLYKEL